METTLLTAGLVFVAAAIIGGGLKAFHIEIPVIDTVTRQVLLGGFGVLLIALAVFGLDTSELADSSPRPTPSGVSPESRTNMPDAPVEEETTPSATGSDAASLEGCVVTISNKLVSLRPKPDPMSQGTADVPSGEYEVEAYETTTHASKEMGFFRITVDGRTGWIANDTWAIESKTTACP